jgi:hypothetical protein
MALIDKPLLFGEVIQLVGEVNSGASGGRVRPD